MTFSAVLIYFLRTLQFAPTLLKMLSLISLYAAMSDYYGSLLVMLTVLSLVTGSNKLLSANWGLKAQISL